MNRGALCFRNQRVRGFLNAVVEEPVRIFRPEDEAGLLRVLQVAIEFLFRVLVDQSPVRQRRRCCPGRPDAAAPFACSVGRRCSLPTIRSITLSV